MEKNILERIIDSVFAIKKTTLCLIIIFFLGFTLRLIAAINLGVAADDMHFVTEPINFLSAGKMITYGQSSGLWHAFTNVIYNMFGMTQLASRIAALLFGSFSILVIYLLSKEFFNERISVMSAFLLAIAPFHIKNTLAEMDVMTMFFVLMGMLLFVKGIKNNKSIYYALGGMFLGLGIYTKVYPLLFIPSLLLYFAYFNYRKKNKVFSKENIKNISIFIAVAFIFVLPTLTHNYLLYKDKGFLDLVFTRITGIGKDVSAQYYSWDSAFDSANSWKGLIFGDIRHDTSGNPLLLTAINFIRIYDPIIFYLGILGILLMLFYSKENKSYLVFFFAGIIFLFPFLAASILLPKHYLFLEVLLIPIVALTVKEVSALTSKILRKDLTIYILLALFIFTLIFLGFPTNSAHFYGKSNIAQIIDFKEENIPVNSLIVADSRIYRGRIHWVSQGRPYLEGSDFLSVLNQIDKAPGEFISLDVYYIECVVDDCGWGTVKNQPDFNASMEMLTDFFKQNGRLLTTISEPDLEKPYFPLTSEEKKTNYAKIYTAKIQLKNSVISLASQPKAWFLYPIGYEPIRENFDYYETNNFFDSLLNKLAHWIVFLAVILSFLSPLYVMYLIKESKYV